MIEYIDVSPTYTHTLPIRVPHSICSPPPLLLPQLVQSSVRHREGEVVSHFVECHHLFLWVRVVEAKEGSLDLLGG